MEQSGTVTCASSSCVCSVCVWEESSARLLELSHNNFECASSSYISFIVIVVALLRRAQVYCPLGSRGGEENMLTARKGFSFRFRLVSVFLLFLFFEYAQQVSEADNALSHSLKPLYVRVYVCVWHTNKM